MHVLVLPVSGGGFVTQLAIIQYLCEVEYIPDVILSSSGGNVAAYVASISEWKWNNIIKVARKLSRDLFVNQWSEISIIQTIIGYYQGNKYKSGKGVYSFLKEYFNKESIQKHEIWTGTYNIKRQKARLFCNLKKEDSILNTDYIDEELTQSMSPHYCNGNIKLISDVLIASACVPGIVPAKTINGEQYLDGGVAGASPLKIMQEPILRYVDENNEPLHLIYVNSIDLSQPEILPCNNIVDTWKQTANNLIRSQTVIDRLSCYELLRCKSEQINKSEFTCNYKNMVLVKQIQDKVRFSMLEIYPNGYYQVDITSFTGDDVLNQMTKAYHNCKCRLWWNPNNFEFSDSRSSLAEVNKLFKNIQK